MNKLLLIDEGTDPGDSLGRVLDPSDLDVTTVSNGEEALRLMPGLQPDLVIMDVRPPVTNGLEILRRIRQLDPSQLVILVTAHGTTQTAIEAMKLGAYDYLLKPFDVPRLKTTVANTLRAARDMRQAFSNQPKAEIGESELGIVGRTDSMQKVFKLVGQLAASDVTVLITGESGTGKEMVARAVYEHGRRNQEAFLAVNCAAIPEHLLESELFGHERGAFTGAACRRIGKFEQCNRGTMFLDEIGDMTPATQTKVLRVLQSGTFERVGGNETVEADVRIIAATNKPLEDAVAGGRFREDLFYRLNVVRVAIPPLRERREDIPLLVDHFLKRLGRELLRPKKALTPGVIEALQRYDWPGNVRELENVIRRALVLSKGEAILAGDLPGEILGAAPRSPSCGTSVSPAPVSQGRLSLPAPPASDRAPDVTAIAQRFFHWAKGERGAPILPTVHREIVAQALFETEGNQVQAARLLGISRPTLRNRIKKFNLRASALRADSACVAG
jgi:two-component system nitrogen regulation response regulator GlnG